jgi:hypothetical protein
MMMLFGATPPPIRLHALVRHRQPIIASRHEHILLCCRSAAGDIVNG